MATKDEILESIASMTVIELKEHIDAVEEKVDVTAAAPVAVAAVGGAAAAPAAEEEQDEFDVVLTGAGDGFCGGYDLKDFAEAAGEQPGSQLGGAGGGDSRPWDPMADFFGMYECTTSTSSPVVRVNCQPTPAVAVRCSGNW